MSHVDMILTEQPQLFALARQEQIEEIGTLVILASSKVLGKLQTSTGLTALRGKPYVSAAKVLNSLVIRFLSSLEQQQHQEEDEGVSIDSKLRIENSLAKALGLACKCLSSTVGDNSSSSSSTTSPPSGLAAMVAMESRAKVKVKGAKAEAAAATAKAMELEGKHSELADELEDAQDLNECLVRSENNKMTEIDELRAENEKLRREIEKLKSGGS